MTNILWFNEVGMNDVPRVGGKNASLGEMITHLSKLGVQVPNGFATTADAYNQFLEQDGLNKKIHQLLDKLDVSDVNALAKAGRQIREWIEQTEFTPDFINDVKQAHAELEKQAGNSISVAVRSSATAEDLPEASFAGQQETFLNVSGIDDVLDCIKKVFASLFNDRAISYRVHQGFSHEQVALSAGIQYMVRSDCGASGVIFSIDTESGFEDVVFITASYGLGEMVVQGAVNPDEFYVHKPTLRKERPAIVRKNLGSKHEKMVYADKGSADKVKVVAVPEEQQHVYCINDDDIMYLANQAVLIESHYGRPMDIEWGKDGVTGKLYILQARPETVASRQHGQVIERFILNGQSNVLVTGRSIGQRIGKGTARLMKNIAEMDKIKEGDVLVTDMTDPDWEPIMKKASAIVTNRGGRTCHAAIIAREMGIPAVVGCGDATQKITDGCDVTVSCAEGETGNVYDGLLDFAIEKAELDKMPPIPLKIMMNVANPDRAFAFQRLPNEGIGLARLEFIINRMIGYHPHALLNVGSLSPELQADIKQATAAYASPREFYVSKLAEGIATLAAAFYPKPIIVRMSDFKSNEYANLIGGKDYEPDEENPMLGFRGAGRYVSESFRDCFQLECEALKRVRNDMGLTNVQIMIPFVRTLNQAKQVVHLLKEQGLERGKDDLKLIMMCEIPSNAILADEFLQYFDGFSIGSNDLTQLTLGIDRDSALVATDFDERDPAVQALMAQAIRTCKKDSKYIGICGQGPSDHPDLAQWLVDEGIDSISLNPDTVVDTWLYLAKHLKSKIS